MIQRLAHMFHLTISKRISRELHTYTQPYSLLALQTGSKEHFRRCITNRLLLYKIEEMELYMAMSNFIIPNIQIQLKINA